MRAQLYPMVLVVLAGVTMSTSLTAETQTQTQAPPGSCQMASGEWCWPLIRVPRGQLCECPTDSGVYNGIMR